MLLAIGTCAPVFLYDMHHDNLEENIQAQLGKEKKKHFTSIYLAAQEVYFQCSLCFESR